MFIFANLMPWNTHTHAIPPSQNTHMGTHKHPYTHCFPPVLHNTHTHCCFRDSDENQGKRLNVHGASFFIFDYSSWKELLVNVWMWKHYCIWLWDVLCSGFIWTGRDACWSPSSVAHPLQPRASLRFLIEVPPNSEDLRLHFSFSLTNYMNSKK